MRLDLRPKLLDFFKTFEAVRQFLLANGPGGMNVQ